MQYYEQFGAIMALSGTFRSSGQYRSSQLKPESIHYTQSSSRSAQESLQPYLYSDKFGVRGEFFVNRNKYQIPKLSFSEFDKKSKCENSVYQLLRAFQISNIKQASPVAQKRLFIFYTDLQNSRYSNQRFEEI